MFSEHPPPPTLSGISKVPPRPQQPLLLWMAIPILFVSMEWARPVPSICGTTRAWTGALPLLLSRGPFYLPPALMPGGHTSAPLPPPRLRMVETLSNLLRSVVALSPPDLLPVLYLSLNRLGPPQQGLELGVGDGVLLKAVAQATGKQGVWWQFQRWGRGLRGRGCRGEE